MTVSRSSRVTAPRAGRPSRVRRLAAWLAAWQLACATLVPVLAVAWRVAPVEASAKKEKAAPPRKKTTPARKRTSTRKPLKPVPAPVGATAPPVGTPYPVQALPPGEGKNVSPQDISDQQQQLDALRDEARKNRELASRLRGREKSVSKDLRRIQQDLGTTTRYLRQLEAREKIVQRQKALTERSLSSSTAHREEQRATLAWRLREIYKFGRDRRLEALMSSTNFATLVQRGDFFQRILEADRALLTQIKDATQRISDHKQALEGTIKELGAISSEKQIESNRLSSLHRQQASLLSNVTTQRKSAEATARQMEASARRIQSLIATLERRRREAEEAARRKAEEAAGGTTGSKPPKPVPSDDKFLANANFGKNRGALSWPVRGAIVGTFGRNVNERFNTVTHNNGIDIAAPAGTEVRAVARGRVELSEYLPGYGNTIILNHGDGYYTIYGYCSSLNAGSGAEVVAGQTIARVGDTDSVKGPALHFEVRHGKEALNPQAWLR